jgi:hypothetical protein
MMAFGGLGLSFFGLQTVLWVMNSNPDKLTVTDSMIQSALVWFNGWVLRKTAEEEQRKAHSSMDNLFEKVFPKEADGKADRPKE